MLPYSTANFPIQPLMEHSFMALVGAAALIVVATLLVVWTVVFYQSASRSPILTFSARRHENLYRLLAAYRQRLASLGADPRYAALDTSARRVILGKILRNLSQQYYRTAGWGNYHPQQLVATDWPELATLISTLSHPDQFPGQTPWGGRAQVSPSDTATLTAALSQISYRSQLHAHALNTRQDLVIKPPRRSRFWIVPVTLTVLCLLVISGLQTQSWLLEQQAVRADRQGDPSLAQDLRLRQADSRLLADRWLVNYNLGTTYLNAGDLQNANKYLSRASKKMPFVLEAKMTEPQAVLAGCQVNYNLALVTIKTSEEPKSTDVLVQAAQQLVYCNQEALKTRQKYWKLERGTPATSKVSASLKRVAKDSDSLIEQIKKRGGSNFRMPSASWFEDFGS
ncbi:hypothetical protein CYK25_000065 [Varibaculum cambriense]|uniref:hypothetical protein n=1 Tax=uncultured Varibaculum sp. TaxID=413896 RepID=UPI000CA8B01D|nr:hypothetical protein [uncultured Varibaculum sp.]WIK88669.1 hypothetical protein CYK25_000065 [Varibaculum cambriense]